MPLCLSITVFFAPQDPALVLRSSKPPGSLSWRHSLREWDVKTKVLLAEDHPAMRAMLAKILLREFEIVADVESGAAAVEAASMTAPDVIVIDVRMPVVDGI